MAKAGKTKPLTAAELILKQQGDLERRIFSLCQGFEARTGMSVVRIVYPGDRDSDFGAVPTDRVQVLIAPPRAKKTETPLVR